MSEISATVGGLVETSRDAAVHRRDPRNRSPNDVYLAVDQRELHAPRVWALSRAGT